MATSFLTAPTSMIASLPPSMLSATSSPILSLVEIPKHPGVRLSQIISALSYALDLTEGQPMGHSVQTCVLGMRIADDLDLSIIESEELYYALLLKDAGCSSNASRMYQMLRSDERQAKRDIKTQDWTRVTLDSLQYLKRNVRPGRPGLERLLAVLNMAVNRDTESQVLIQTRCERGADIARKMGFPERTALAIHSLDEHWNGKGYPRRLKGEEIPLYSRIMNLAQTLDVFISLYGPRVAIEMAVERGGRWFDPDLVAIVSSWHPREEIWAQLHPDTARQVVEQLAPEGDHVAVDEARLDTICEAFADVIDAKSPFTYHHSNGVSDAAIGMARAMGVSPETETQIRRAALLHDIGKLSVSNSILEKPGKLTDAEWQAVRQHPYYTQKILEHVPIFKDFAYIAATHHEKLDGTGYHQNLQAEQLPTATRILTLADIFDALVADRPYRPGLPLDRVFKIIEGDVPHALDRDCYDALRAWLEPQDWANSVQALNRANRMSPQQ